VWCMLGYGPRNGWVVRRKGEGRKRAWASKMEVAKTKLFFLGVVWSLEPRCFYGRRNSEQFFKQVAGLLRSRRRERESVGKWGAPCKAHFSTNRVGKADSSKRISCFSLFCEAPPRPAVANRRSFVAGANRPPPVLFLKMECSQK